jgi:hypothetical protein
VTVFRIIAAGLLPGLLFVAAAAAQENASQANPFGRLYPPRIYTTMRLTGPPPEIDGRLDDDAWQQGEWAGDYTQQIPVEGAKPSRPTALKVLYDERHVYVAIRAYDDPAQISRFTTRRDSFAGDIVGICFDSYADKRTGFEFDLNAAGSKIDLILTNEGWDTSWDAVWHGKVGLEADAWTAEFQIPLSQLRYGSQEQQVWGLHAWRWIERHQEESQWNLIPRNSTGRMYNLGELHGIRGLRRSRHVELLPHTVAELEGRPAEAGDPYRGGVERGGAVGLDVKVGLTSDITLDATINPDFGQVEADPSVVNLSAYETFYEEKRPFFVEGKRILSLNLDGSTAAGDAFLGGGTDEMLFYSRRIGQPPSVVPRVGPGEFADLPDQTSILSAVKVTGKTPGGLSIGVLQSVTGHEEARLWSAGFERRVPVEPMTSYFVARLQKDWRKGNTILGGIMTSTNRSIDDPELAVLPSSAFTGAFDFAQFLGNRAYVVEAKAAVSRIAGHEAAMTARQLDPVHLFQRAGADHLTFDADARSLAGHGGAVRVARYGNSKWRWWNTTRWGSPGFDLNDVGFLRQADFVVNEAAVAFAQTEPRGPFRSYTVQLERDDGWDFGRLHTEGESSLTAQAAFRNLWEVAAGLEIADTNVETRDLRGGPAIAHAPRVEWALGGSTDRSRRVVVSADVERDVSTEGGSRQTGGSVTVRLRLSTAFSVSMQALVERNTDDLQYVATVDATAQPKYVLGRLHQRTAAATIRADLHITPDLSVQYYGSPFVSNGRFGTFKRAADTLAPRYADRVYVYGPGEITVGPDGRIYAVDEPAGRYGFRNPDFSFREFRSNLVARWEFSPGSSLYLVWSQGRTSVVDVWDPSLGRSLDALWRTPANNIVLAKFSYWIGL